MTPSVLDTDILSEIMKGYDPVVSQNVRRYQAEFGVLTFTSLSVLEIIQGLRQKRADVQMKRAEALFASNQEIVPDSADYRLAGEILGDLLRNGHPVGLADPIIAACAIRRQLTLVTGNQRHFEAIISVGHQLSLSDWRQEA